MHTNVSIYNIVKRNCEKGLSELKDLNSQFSYLLDFIKYEKVKTT